MSMLAEKKRKQKWSLNPQGKHWISDSNKFGLKILEGLGWKEGKGLGKQQHGITEPIKISYKNDNKGLGLKETQSSLQQEHFNNLLATLNDTTPPNSSPMPVGSLEEKSQNSRARVHYKKFTRGKDISRYSQKDLASIFEKKGETAESKTINAISTSGHFKHRVPQPDKSDDEGASPGFGFKNPAFEPMGQSFTMVKHTLEPIVETENERDTSAVVDDDKGCPNEFEVKRKSKKSKRGDSEKKKKPKKTKNECVTDGGIDNPALHVDVVGTDIAHVKKKTKKKKNGVPQVGDAPSVEIVDGGGGKRKQNEDQAPVDLNCKVKKRKKHVAPENKVAADGIDNPAFNPVSVPDIQCDLIMNVVEEPVAETKRSKSNKKSKSAGLDNYGFDAKTQRIDESMATLSNTIETYQAEVENDMNECKDAGSIEEYNMVVGVSNERDGENERVEGGVVLRYKYAAFGKDPHWAARNNQSVSFARKSYKHLIQGDIVVGFNESNLHEIKGYGNRR
ncbi:hypothetical protein PPYR_03551 [Photinus pyralis]|uniref:G-patch domain-containing protein n=1 Tax=Photinus pyralis TaxID=7054 RepID=A0A1Y1LD54_PHOPY|nr:PIN2/TERF1-interacting telomerase inhibitor 1 [Photinus pyralis]KAB0791751.1 hypothetical protein PPYR_03551 [Photinus pyralis]